MAQGRKKIVKPIEGKKKKTIPKVKKGTRVYAPKTNTKLQEIAVKKAILKGINSNIEEALTKAMVNDNHKFKVVKRPLTVEPKKKVAVAK